MNVLGVFLGLFFLTVITNFVAVSCQATTQPPENDTNCTELPGNTNVDSFLYVHNIASQGFCIRELVGNGSVKKFLTLEDARYFVREFCPKKLIMEHCLNQHSLLLERCHNGTVIQMFKIYADILKRLVSFGCSETGNAMALFIYEVATSDKNETTAVVYGKCLLKGANVLKLTVGSNADVAISSFHMHRKLASLKECFLLLPMGDGFKDVVESVFQIISTHMQCVHPLDASLVPCKAVDPRQLNSSHICRIAGGGGEQRVVYAQLEEYAGKCLYQLMTTGQNTTTVTKAVERFCSADEETSLGMCLDEETMRADICLQEHEAREYVLFRDLINTAVEASCKNSGQLLTHVLTRASPHLLNRCIQTARETQQDSNQTNNLRFYHQGKTFKGCLLDAFQGHEQSVQSAQWLLDETLQNAECFLQLSNNRLPCKQITNI